LDREFYSKGGKKRTEGQDDDEEMVLEEKDDKPTKNGSKNNSKVAPISGDQLSGGQISFDEEPKVLRYNQNDLNMMIAGMSESMDGSRTKWAGKTPPPAYTSRPSSSLNEMIFESRNSSARTSTPVHFDELYLRQLPPNVIEELSGPRATKVDMDEIGNNETIEVQKISIAVSEPKNHFHLGDFGKVYYTIVTRNLEGEFTTEKTYQDIIELYKYLDGKYLIHGVIVPPPPPKQSLKLIEDIQKDVNLMSDGERKVSASKTIDKKCVALDRYIKTLFRHPVLSKDVILNEFIRDDNAKEELSKTQPKYKGSNNIIAWRIKMLGSKNENDDWFMIRHEELKALHQEMSQTLESFKAVTKSKNSLRGKSADVKGILQQ